MRFEDQPASGADTGAADPSTRSRRRTPRSWSVPAGGDRFDRPATEEDWARDLAAAATPAPPPPRRRLGDPPPPPPGPDFGPLTSLLGDLRGELAHLRSALEATAAVGDGSLVTGPELAASIEALGTTLGSGIAALLTEHRSLLARDVEGAAVRILEEVSQRLRTTSAGIVDGVEERVRHVNVKSLGDVVEQLDLRLDQLQADLTGLRAVMLEIPDQTAVVERLDQLAETKGNRPRDPGRITPAMGAAIERSVGNAVGRLQEEMEQRVAGLGRGGEGLDADTIEAFTAEMTALRRRISLRNEAQGDAVELSDRQLDDLADRIAARMGGTPRASTGRSTRAARIADELDDDVDPDMEVPRRAKRTSKRR